MSLGVMLVGLMKTRFRPLALDCFYQLIHRGHLSMPEKRFDLVRRPVHTCRASDRNAQLALLLQFRSMSVFRATTMSISHLFRKKRVLKDGVLMELGRHTLRSHLQRASPQLAA